jgi:chromosomal replication initiation ATPase DnaA
MEDVIKTVSEFTGVPVDDIKSRNRTHDVCVARRMFIYLSKEVYGDTISSIAIFLNKRTHQDVSSQLIDFEQHLRVYKGLRKKMEEIKNAVV